MSYDINDFNNDLARIINSAYGEEVTQSIHDAILFANSSDQYGFKYNGFLHENDDISANTNFWQTGMWMCVHPRANYSDNNEDGIPIGWPVKQDGTTAGSGRLIVFGSDSTSSTANKVQMVMVRNDSEVYWRIGQGSSTWSDWRPISSFESKGTLSSSDDLNNVKFCRSGMWSAYIASSSSDSQRSTMWSLAI